MIRKVYYLNYFLLLVLGAEVGCEFFLLSNRIKTPKQWVDLVGKPRFHLEVARIASFTNC